VTLGAALAETLTALATSGHACFVRCQAPLRRCAFEVVAGSSRARHNLKIVVLASTAALARLALPSFFSAFLFSLNNESVLMLFG
jgi:hypothetical protein